MGKAVWKHADRQVVFIADLIDRGNGQRETVDIARRMVDAGSAQIVLGNHEFNAIAWSTPNPDIPGEFLRSHSRKVGKRNRKQALTQRACGPFMQRELLVGDPLVVP